MWDQHDLRLFEGIERFTRPNYLGNLVAYWIPSLDGVEVMLKRVAKVANGGFGASTIIMVKAYPTPIFTDFDYHKPSILTARKRAKEAGPRKVTFVATTSTDLSRQAIRPRRPLRLSA